MSQHTSEQNIIYRKQENNKQSSYSAVVNTAGSFK